MSYELILGDAREVLDHIQCDTVLTDPPYGVSFKGKRTKHRVSESNEGYANLDDSGSIIETTCLPVVNKCIERFGRVVVMPGVRNLFKYPEPADIGCVFCSNGAGMGRWGFTCAHPILYYGKCPYLAKCKGSRPNGFSDTQAGEKVDGFPCPKPIKWMRWLVERASMKGDTICDPFMGSGTTGLACLELGRNFIGIEIDPTYYAIAKRRIDERASYLLV